LIVSNDVIGVCRFFVLDQNLSARNVESHGKSKLKLAGR